MIGLKILKTKNNHNNFSQNYVNKKPLQSRYNDIITNMLINNNLCFQKVNILVYNIDFFLKKQFFSLLKNEVKKQKYCKKILCIYESLQLNN